MRLSLNRRSSVSASTSRLASVLAAMAGAAASAHAAIFTFTPTCAPFNWTSFCNTVTPCGGGNFTTFNNFGNTACGVSPLLPGAADDVFFAGNGTINAGSGVRTITINPGVSVTQATNINTSIGYANNGMLLGGAGSQSWSNSISNAGTWTEDGAGWDRSWNSVTFTNTGTMRFPGSITLNHGSGANVLTSSLGATIIKNGGGISTFNGPITTTNAGAVTSNAGGALNFNSLTFTSNAGATYAASAGGTINFGSCNIRGTFPMTLGANNLVTFSNTTCGAPVTFNATGGAALLAGNFTASAPNPFTNNGLVNTAAGSQSRGGPFTNSVGAIWTEDGAGWDRNFNSHSFANAGTLNFPGTVIWQHASGVNPFSNSGTVVKSGGGTMSMNNFPRTNTGTMNVLANGGTLQFNSNSFASTGGANYNVTGPNSSIYWNTNTISGTFPISLGAGGTAFFTSPVTSAPTTITSTGAAAVITAGSMNTTAGLLTNSGLLAFGAGSHSWSGPWTNSNTGTITEDAAGWDRGLNSVAVTNNGTLNFPGTVIWNHISGTNSVTNSGTINKTAGGQLSVNNIASFTSNGTIAVAAGGGNVFLSSLAYTGTGNITIGAGGGMQLNSCTVSGPLNATNSGGTFQSTGTMTVPAAGAQLNVTGSGFTVNSNLSITGGGLLRNNNVANVTGGSKSFSGDITNSAGATWTEDNAGWDRSLGSVDFTNAGTLNLPGTVIWNHASGTNTLLNTGTINKTSGGQFSLNNITSVTNDGTIAVAVGGGNTFLSSLAYSGTGTVTMNSGGGFQLNNCSVSGPLNGTNAGGTIQSTGTLTTTGGGASLNVTGTGFSFNSNKGGAPLLTNTGIVTVTGGDKSISGAITNALGATWTEDNVGWSRSMNSSVFTNNGTLNLPGTVIWNHASGVNSLTNGTTGVVNKTAGGAFNLGFSTSNSGLIDIQSGTYNANGGIAQSASTGIVRVRSGAVLGGATWNMLGGRLEGRGTVNQVFTNSGGTVAPGESISTNGILSFANTFTQTAGGTYEVSLFGRPLTGHDRIISTNQMNLAGTLRVVITPPFLPKLGDVYEICRSNSNQRVGTFSSVVVDGPAAVTVSVTYTTSSAFLTITGTDCGSIDFNNDTSFFDPQDIDAFLSVYGEGDCIPATATCNDIDFNNDASIFDPCDIDSFLLVFGEGPCTPCGV